MSPGHGEALGCYSIDVFLGPESGPEPVPSHDRGFQTCLNLECPSTEFGLDHGPVLSPVLGPKFKMSIELTPRWFHWPDYGTWHYAGNGLLVTCDYEQLENETFGTTPIPVSGGSPEPEGSREPKGLSYRVFANI